MNNTELRKLHNALLYIMDEIDRICELNHINYTLTGGSLIGAIRHKGFIPWDDDMDVAMLRADYDIFVNICKTQLDERFIWQDIHTDLDYPYGFGKLTLKETQYISKGHENEKWQKGIYIDVFPLDNVPDNQFSQRLFAFKNLFYIKLLECKTGFDIDSKSLLKKIAFFVLFIISKLLTFDYLRQKMEKNMVRYKNKNMNLICNLGGFYGFYKELTFRSYFEETMRAKFEDRKYRIIRDYDIFLRSVYGDYMSMPPVERRHTHEFVQLDYGKYDELF